jgi:hypothetical protein
MLIFGGENGALKGAILGVVFWFDGLGDLGVKFGEQRRRKSIAGFIL